MKEVDFVFYLVGADPFVGDRWGRLKLSEQGLAQRDTEVLEALAEPVTIVLGGDYASIEDVAEIHTHTVELAVQSFQR